MRIFTVRIATALLALMGSHLTEASEMKVAVTSNFPGGNIVVDGNEGATVKISPDLRTSKPWFYWYFEAEASHPGRVTFVLPPSKIGVRGPAVSVDEGKTWTWLGTDQVTFAKPKAQAPEAIPQDTFSYDFTQANQKVRFSVGFPYVQSNLDEFLKKNAGNPNLVQSILATTQGGKPVELLQIGQPGEGKITMVVAARSHACEALASYVLEGFLQEAMSDAPAGTEFRKKFVLYAVPILDKDGVEAGDQGKNRAPHDHNRDYGTDNLYPEIKALEELAIAKRVQVGIDFHDPALKTDIHEAFHWFGLKIPPIDNNLTELNGWLSEERPLVTNTAIPLLAEPADPRKTEGVPFSWHFAYLENALLAITLESPYAQAETVDVARAYGSGLARALVRTELLPADPAATRGSGAYAAFAEFQKNLTALIAQPAAAEALADPIIKDPAALPIYRAQANLGMALVRQREKNFSEALTFAQTANSVEGMTNSQKAQILTALVSIQTRNPDATLAEVEAAAVEFEAFPNPAPAQQFSSYRDLSDYFTKRGDHEKALAFANKGLENALPKDKSAALTRAIVVLETLGKKDEAIARRQELVALIRPQIVPVATGRSIMLGTMAGEMFDALIGIPTATMEEKREAAHAILNYPTLPAAVRKNVEDWLKQNGESKP